jgi:hypothetical protein
MNSIIKFISLSIALSSGPLLHGMSERYQAYVQAHGNMQPQPVLLKKISFERHERLLVLHDASHQVIDILHYDRDVHTFSEFEAEFGQYFDLSQVNAESKKYFKQS